MPLPAPTILRRGFVDVCRGYSVGRYEGKPVYVKHLSHTDHLGYDDLRVQFEADAVAQGALTEAQRLVYLKEKGLWTDAKEAQIATHQDIITRFHESRRLEAKPSLIRIYEKQIEDETAKLTKIMHERIVALGVTVESYAQERLNDFYIINNLFTDVGLQNPLFTETTFDDFGDSTVQEIVKVYQTAIEPCTDTNLRALSCQTFFISYYSVCNDDLSAFFGRPVAQMTYYQIRLGNFARYFKSIMTNSDLSKLDSKLHNDPDAIERVFTAQKNHQAMGQDKVPTGMTQEDIKTLGLEGQLSELPKKNMGFAEFAQHIRSSGKTVG